MSQSRDKDGRKGRGRARLVLLVNNVAQQPGVERRTAARGVREPSNVIRLWPEDWQPDPHPRKPVA